MGVSQWLSIGLQWLSNRLSDQDVIEFTRPYIAGTSIDEVITEAKNEIMRHNRHVSIDLLGEESLSRESAEQYRDTFLDLIGRIKHDFHEEISYSVKPSGLALVRPGQRPIVDPQDLQQNLTQIVDAARANDKKVTLDMEDSRYTDISLDMAKHFWGQGYENFGIVLQSRLDRTHDDITHLFRTDNLKTPYEKRRVRLCIGIYPEKEGATKSKPEMKKRLYRQAERLIEAGVYLEVATHDHELIDNIAEYVLKNHNNPQSNADKKMIEFQFLRGVPKAYKKEAELMKDFIVRYYTPFYTNEQDGIAYMRRRASESPATAIYAAKRAPLVLAKKAQRGFKKLVTRAA